MSQRSSGILTSLSQKPKSQGKSPVVEFFKSVLRDSGVILSSSDDPNVVTQEQALVVRDIEKCLGESPDSTEKFFSGLKSLCKKEKYFRKALLPTLFRKTPDDGSDVQIQQESLFRILLKVGQLQKDVIDVLLDEITSAASEENQDTSWLRLLLTQLRYLPHIKQTEALSTKLLDVMEIATFPCQLEILDSIPEILPDSEYSETAKELAKLLDKNEELSGAIIDCLNALNLDLDIRARVQDHILAKILAGTSIKIFPVLLDFLMTDCKAQNLTQTLFKVRNALDTIMASPNTNKEKESGKIVIFNRLQALATTPKVVSEAWIGVISAIKVHTDHKPVDLLILFMLHSNAKLKKRAIEIIFRKRVKDGLFKCSLIEQFFDKYLPQQLLRDYFQSMVEVGCSLLRTSSEAGVVEFASTLFKQLFSHQHMESIYRQEMLDSLILLTGASDHVTPVLRIFSDLLEEIAKTQHHTVLLMRLLEKLDSFELKDVKLVFEILCALTCSDESLSGLKDEIHMIVRKQLSSSKRVVKHRGIMSAVVMAKHVASTTEDQSEVSIADNSILSIAQLGGDAREAAALLDLANTSTAGCPELLSLYYDQLASMLIKTDNLDKHFVTWLYETITNDFQNVFVTETVPDPINDLEFSMQYNLNSTEEMDAPLAVNVAELTLKPEANPGSILILAPHFRLLRLLHYWQHAGDLSSIDALLGCSVVLPKIDDVDLLDSDQVKQVADCLFHCINWFRETISGFVTQKSKKLRHKIVRRLDDLIELEKLLGACMDNAPEHKLPSSYYDAFSQSTKSASPKEAAKAKRPRKKLKPNETADESAVPSTSKAAPKKAAKAPKQAEDRAIDFREIDTDLVILLKYPLVFGDPPADRTSLNIRQLSFILRDFASKLALLTTGRNLGLSRLTIVSPADLVKDCVQIFPNVNKHLEAVVGKIAALLKTTDGCHDHPDMFTDEVAEIKTCFGLILESLALLFSWSGFQHSKRLDLLRDILKALRPPESSQTLNSANRLIAELVDRLCGYADYCMHLSHAVSLVKVLEALYSFTPSPEIRNKVVKTSGKLLGQRWSNLKGSPDSGKGSSANIDVLVKSYLNGANVKTICGLVGTLQEQAPELKSKEDSLRMLASIDKANFYILYRNLWNSLHERVKFEIQSLTNNEHLTLWRTTALTMQGLMTVVKAQETKSNLVCFLKKSIAILKIFLSHGIPILEIMLRSKPDQVVEIFKTVQTNTRFLHHLCCYSKVTKDGGLMAYVPQFRLTLETLVYRVKAALVANGCSEAFWMGNLKNRDLQGEDIVSQSTENTESRESEEELPEDDESDDDIFSNEGGEGDSRPESEVFD